MVGVRAWLGRPLPGTAVRSALVRLALPLLAVAAIVLLDIAMASRQPVAVKGALDEPAHLLTAWLLLAAVPAYRTRGVWPWALIGAIAIDMDHIPLYAWGVLASSSGRPVTHSVLTVMVLAAAALLTRQTPALRLCRPLLGLAVGVLLHFVRDLASGGGVPLLWPLLSEGARLPWAVYVGAMVLVALIATGQRWREPQAVRAPSN
jgi:inner membrane protein